MKPVIDPVDKKLLKAELTPDKLLRPTNKANNEIYIITAHDSPNTMREIGRLRELSFRSWGGGTGQEIDIDPYDEMENPYKQLIVWNPEVEEIIGGYRFLSGADIKLDEKGQPMLVMSHLFEFSQQFIDEYLPYSIELGRAFIQPDYQTAKMGTKSLFALDNLWDGLGALVLHPKKARYFIGKINIYDSYPDTARDLLYAYMFKYFPDKDGFIRPKEEVSISAVHQKLADEIFIGKSSSEDYKILQKYVRTQNETIPPMFNAYIGLTETMRMFGTTKDPDFSDTFETAIMITMADLIESKRKRYIEPYIEYMKRLIEERKIAKQQAKEKRQARRKARSNQGKGLFRRKKGE